MSYERLNLSNGDTLLATHLQHIEDGIEEASIRQPLTFTGAVEATYDGTEPISVEIPSGGGGGYRLIRKIVVDENNQASGYIITTDEDGNPFALKHIYIVADLTIGSYRSDGVLHINDILFPWVFSTVADAEYYHYFQADIVGEDYMLTRQTQRLPTENPKQGENTGLKKLTGSITDIRFNTSSHDAFYGIGTTFEIYGY